MVVLVIIGLLAGAVGVGVRTYLVRARQDTARMEIATITDAVEAYYAVYGQYPSNEQGLAVLSEPSEKLVEPLLKQKPIDPWDRPYQYNQPGREGAFEVFSLGADGQEGGTGEDRDIGSWQLKEGTGE